MIQRAGPRCFEYLYCKPGPPQRHEGTKTHKGILISTALSQGSALFVLLRVFVPLWPSLSPKGTDSHHGLPQRLKDTKEHKGVYNWIYQLRAFALSCTSGNPVSASSQELADVQRATPTNISGCEKGEVYCKVEAFDAFRSRPRAITEINISDVVRSLRNRNLETGASSMIHRKRIWVSRLRICLPGQSVGFTS